MRKKTQDQLTPKQVKVEKPKKRRAPKKQEPDFDKMTDEEIEEYFYK